MVDGALTTPCGLGRAGRAADRRRHVAQQMLVEKAGDLVEADVTRLERFLRQHRHRAALQRANRLARVVDIHTPTRSGVMSQLAALATIQPRALATSGVAAGLAGSGRFQHGTRRHS